MKCSTATLLTLALLATPARADRITTAPEASSITSGPADDWSKLGSQVRITGELGSFADGVYRVLLRERLPGGRWQLTVWPPPGHAASFDAGVETVAHIFSDGFEAGWVWAWSAVAGAHGGGGGNVNPHGPYYVIHLTDGTDDYLFGTVAGHSAAGDTPANTRIRPGLSFGTSHDFKAYERIVSEDGRAAFLFPGGVVQHPTYSFTIPNRQNPTSRVGELDDLLNVDFRNQPAILYACYPTKDINGWRVSPLAGPLCGVETRGTVIAAGFQGNTSRSAYAFAFREQTAAYLDLETTPVQLTGLARGVRIEDGGPAPNAEIRRADTASLYDETTDQWLSWIFARTGAAIGSAIYTFADSPIWRIRHDPASTDILVQAKNAAGTWQTVGAAVDHPIGDTGAITGLLVNYDLSATSATLYRDAVQVGTPTTITGGLFASGTGDLIFYNTPTASTVEVMWFAARAGQRLLDAAEIEDRSMYAFRPAGESSLTMSLEFNVGRGTTIDDQGSEGVDAIMNNFADAAGAWVESGLGEPGDAHFRPPYLCGRPNWAPLRALGVTTPLYSAGYNPNRAISGNYRTVTSSGGRLTPGDMVGSTGVVGVATRTSTFTAPNRIDGFPMTREPASRAKYTASGTVSNNTQFTILRVILDPRRGPDGTWTFAEASVIVDETVVTEAAVSTTWTLDSPPGWDKATTIPITGSPPSGGVTSFLHVQLYSEFASPLAGSFGRVGSADRAMIEEFIEDAGPEAASVTKRNLAGMKMDDYGWRGEGSRPAGESAHELALATAATDFSPTAFFLTHGGSPVASGFQRAPAAEDWAWPELSIETAEPRFSAARFGSVRVLYSPSWTTQGDVVNAPLAAAEDGAVGESLVPWLEVTRGTGTPRLTVKTYFHEAEDAAAHADALLDLLQNGRPYVIHLRAPRPLAELTTLLAFDVAEVTLGADAYLASGRKGCIVAYKVNRDGSAVALVYFVGS